MNYLINQRLLISYYIIDVDVNPVDVFYLSFMMPDNKFIKNLFKKMSSCQWILY